MNGKILLGGAAALTLALGSVVVINLLRTRSAPDPAAAAPAHILAKASPRQDAPAGSGATQPASSPTPRAPLPGQTEQPMSQTEQPTKRTATASMQNTAAVQPAQSAFGGTWLLDKARSEGLPPGMDQVMTVTPSTDGINIETKLASARGEETVREGYLLNGQQVEFTSQRAGGIDSKGVRKARLTAGGRGIEVVEQATVNTSSGPVPAEITREWMLSDDGHSLTIKITFKGANLIYDNKRLFLKQ